MTTELKRPCALVDLNKVSTIPRKEWNFYDAVIKAQEKANQYPGYLVINEHREKGH